MGHLKERSLKDQMAKDPAEVIRKAVLRMLPRNKLRDVSTILSISIDTKYYFILFSDISLFCGNAFYFSV